MTTRTPEHSPRKPYTATPIGRYTVEFNVDSWPEDKVGGKANGLYQVARAGLQIPNGFVITTDAFDQVIERIVPLVSSVEELQEALLESELPESLSDEIRQKLGTIGATKWAVRSSAIAEDGTKSFAGQQHTVLNAMGLDGVLRALREVWASLYDKRGLAYRTRLAIDEVPTGMAVIVEEMLAPESGGVLFTRNPITHSIQECMVSAARHSAMAVVSGEEAVDTYTIERPSGYVTSQEIADVAVLKDDVLADFARISEQVERIFGGHAMDVEWAFARTNRLDDRLGFYILQARPVTHESVRDSGQKVWTNTNVGEALPGVATPLTWSILKGFSRRGFDQAFESLGLDVPEDAELVGSFYGRVYLNLSEFVNIASAIPLLTPERLFAVAGGGGVKLLEEDTPKRSYTRFISRLPQTVPRIVASQAAMPFVAPLWERYFDARCEEFFAKDLYRLNHSALADELTSLDVLFDRNGLVMLTVSSNFLMSYMVTTQFLRWFGTDDVARHEGTLFNALDVQSAEPGRALLEMGRIARRSRRIRKIISETPARDVLVTLREQGHFSDVEHLLDELDDFQRRFGHRAPREAELATSRWREDVTFIFEVIRGFIDSGHLPSPREVARERQRALDEIDDIIDRSFAPGFKTTFKGILGVSRTNARLRESMRARVVDSLDMYRHFFLECGRRMVERGHLRAIDDVFFLQIDEIKGWLGDVALGQTFRVRVLVRRAMYEVFQDLPDPPHTFLLRGTEIISAEEAELRLSPRDPRESTGRISGLSASGGRVTGRAKVILDPNSGTTIEPGEILVVPYADVGWTPLFIAASAVVMNLGGPLSHAAIVAREFQIPAVVNAKHATERIKTGDMITVDGDQGIVYLQSAT